MQSSSSCQSVVSAGPKGLQNASCPKSIRVAANRDLRGNRYGEQVGKAGREGQVTSPSIKPEQRGGAGPDLNRGPYPEDREELDDRLPELGATSSLAEGEGLSAQIFVPDNVKPKTAHALQDAPQPTGEKSDVHPLRTHNAQAALLSGLANVRPTDHMILLLVILASPVEARLDFGNLMVQGLVEAVEAHKKQEEAGEGRVDENSPGRLR